MESKLKALKVADLKTVLRNASLPVPPRANKADLIAKILVEPAAVDAYNALHNPTEVVPQQDAPFEPTSTKLVLPAEPPAGPPLSPEVQDSPPPDQAATLATQPAEAVVVDEVSELEKHKARAARFGIPLVEPKKPHPRGKITKKEQKLPDDEAKLKARAERFGTNASTEASPLPKKKRGAEESVDPDELERRRKRAQRFGLPLANASQA